MIRTLSYTPTMDNQTPGTFPSIAPPDVVICGTLREFITEDFESEKDVQELLLLMFDEPECKFYYFKNVNEPLNRYVAEAEASRDLRFEQYEDYFYQRPNADRSFVNISPGIVRRLGDRVADIIRGPRYIRITLQLSEKKRRGFELQSIKTVISPRENRLLKFWGLGSFWLFILAFVVATVLFIQSYDLSWWRFLLVMASIEAVLIVIGALTLRTSGDLSETNFLELIKIAFRYQFSFKKKQRREERS